MKTTRSAINRLTSEGIDIKIYQPPIKEGLLQKLEMVSNNWLAAMNQKEIAFTQGVFDRIILKEGPTPSCIRRRTEAATRSRPSLREYRRRREQSELRGWLHPALPVEGATRAP